MLTREQVKVVVTKLSAQCLHLKVDAWLNQLLDHDAALRDELIAWQHSAKSAEALEAEITALTTENERLEQELESVRIALGLKGIESRPYACYITDLTAQLAAMTQERDTLRERVNIAAQYSCDSRFEIDELKQQLAEREAQYFDLIMQVGNKYPGESRHETAKRYIIDRERFSIGGPAQEAGPLEPPHED